MYVLVYESVLRDDDEFQLAHAYRFVQVPDLWWFSNPNSDTDSYANPDTNTNTNADSYSDANPNTGSAE